MENLEQQKRIINLGKTLVNELGLDNDNDTLSRWMAHYIAEKIDLAESKPVGKGKNEVKKECFETILKLWEHRWSFPEGKRPLNSYASILNVLEKINPENPDLLYHRFAEQKHFDLDEETLSPPKVNIYAEAALTADVIARTLISDLLHMAALSVNDKKINNLINDTSNLKDNVDIRAIRIILENGSKDNDDSKDDGFEKQYQIDKIKKRIGLLKSFTKINKLILNNYKRQLKAL